MKKIIIHNKQLKNIVNDDWQKNIIELATYKTLLKESINYEKKLIQDIQFLTVLKDELNINSMLNIELLNIYDEIIKKCWKVTYFGYGGIGYERYFDRKLKWKIINNYNKDIKFSNQKQKQQIINNNFKSNNKKREYENWKEDYFKSISEKITKNNIEEGMDALEFFKNEINSNDFQNSQPSTSWYKPNSPTR